MAIGSNRKYTKEQRRKAKYIQDSYEEKDTSAKKAQQHVKPKLNKQPADAPSNSGRTEAEWHSPEWQHKAAWKEPAKSAVKTMHKQTESTEPEQGSIDEIRKKVRKKHALTIG